MTAAYRQHPERFVRRPPAPPVLPATSWITRREEGTHRSVKNVLRRLIQVDSFRDDHGRNTIDQITSNVIAKLSGYRPELPWSSVSQGSTTPGAPVTAVVTGPGQIPCSWPTPAAGSTHNRRLTTEGPPAEFNALTSPGPREQAQPWQVRTPASPRPARN